MADRPPDLGELERQVMQLVGGVGNHLDAIPSGLPASRRNRRYARAPRLEDKGYITQPSTAGPTSFRAAEPRRVALRVKG